MKLLPTMRIWIIIAASTLLLTVGCTVDYEVELDSDFVRCVIFGQITTDTLAHRVQVARTADYFENKPPIPISGANITITDGNNIFALIEDPDDPGSYYTQPDVYGVPGRTYTLHVNDVDLLGDGDLHSYQATSELKPVANADSIQVEFYEQWNGWVIKAWAVDPAATEDYYKFLAYVNGELHSDTLRSLIVTDDILYNGSSTNGIEVYFFSGENSLNPGDTITCYFCGITKDYFKFIMEAQAAARPSNPMFSGPPANPRTNLSNDAVGYFTAYSISKASAIVK